MTTKLIDPHALHGQSPEDAASLQAALAQLIGEPFRFARVSYGDELTLHFGDVRPARSPRLKDKQYGAYILGVRGSAWVLKSFSERLVLTPDAVLDFRTPHLSEPFDKRNLESKQYIQPGSRVLGAFPFVVQPVPGFGLQLVLSDGGSLVIIPTASEAALPGEEGLPELADWEVLSPYGLLQVGPGFKWKFDLA